MVKLSRDTKMALAIMAVACVLAAGMMLLLRRQSRASGASKKRIAEFTDEWIQKVAVDNDPQAVEQLFCSDGRFVGTIKKVKIDGDAIENYFEYFAKLPGVKVVSKKYDIQRLTSDVYINNAFVTWAWDGLEKPVTQRMSFIFRTRRTSDAHCIFQLRTSATTATHTYTRKDFTGYNET